MVRKENEVLIGVVGVDSGQLMVVDPCYIDDEWKKEPFDMKEKAVFKDGHEEEIERCSERWWEILEEINDGKIQLVPIPPKEMSNFSYNAVSHKTLSEEGYGQLNYNMGHPGVAVAFRSGIGDGVYPVYATIEEVDGWGERIVEVRIDMMNELRIKGSGEGNNVLAKAMENAPTRKRGKVERNN